MRIRTIVTATALLTSLVACSSGPKESPAKARPATTTSVAPVKLKPLAPIYTPKLKTAADGSVATCMTPSSDACADALTGIMLVVADVEDDIEKPGRGPYPATTDQIEKMNAATSEYLNDGCQGDPAADGPNSECSGVVAITIGASTLQMTLMTDDISH